LLQNGVKKIVYRLSQSSGIALDQKVRIYSDEKTFLKGALKELT